MTKRCYLDLWPLGLKRRCQLRLCQWYRKPADITPKKIIYLSYKPRGRNAERIVRSRSDRQQNTKTRQKTETWKVWAERRVRRVVQRHCWYWEPFDCTLHRRPSVVLPITSRHSPSVNTIQHTPCTLFTFTQKTKLKHVLRRYTSIGMMWHDCSSDKYTSIDAVGLMIWRHTLTIFTCICNAYSIKRPRPI